MKTPALRPILGRVRLQTRQAGRAGRRQLNRWSGRLTKFAAVVGAAVVVSGAGLYVSRAVEHEWFWRTGEYDKLTRLRAGFDLRYFEDQLGTPVVSRVTRQAPGYRESAFRGRGYWVETVSHAGVVELYAVTSCDRSFKPTFTIQGSDTPVTLNSSTLADVDVDDRYLGFSYLLGASAPTVAYEYLPGYLGGYYKTFIWGFNGLCGFPSGLHFPAQRPNEGIVSNLRPSAEKFREQAVVNTFAETAPGVPLERRGHRHPYPVLGELELRQFHGFYIGPDRVITQSG